MISGKNFQKLEWLREKKRNTIVSLSKKFCPNGCPCPDYDCSPTTTQVTTTTSAIRKDWIFAINTYGETRSILIDGFGESKDTEFEFSLNTEVHYSCSVLWGNQMYVFGGKDNPNQISRIEDCRLTSIGALDFRTYGAACTNFADNLIFICFHDTRDFSTYKSCYKTNGPLETFQPVKNSTFDHSWNRIDNNKGTNSFKLLNQAMNWLKSTLKHIQSGKFLNKGSPNFPSLTQFCQQSAFLYLE